jgi:hypothetical protein
VPLLFGLNVVDCARLAVVSRECHSAVSENACWKEALDALEHDFQLVYVEGSDREAREAEDKIKWRVKLEEPRYKLNRWKNAASDMHRFGRLLPFAQKTVGVLRGLGLEADDDNWMFDFEDPRCFDASNPQRDVMLHLKHLCDNYVERYVIVMKLAHAHVAEGGFHESDDDPDSEEGRGPYHYLDGAVKEYIDGVRGQRLMFGAQCGSSFRDWILDIICVENCGTDEHIAQLNNPGGAEFRLPGAIQFWPVA